MPHLDRNRLKRPNNWRCVAEGCVPMTKDFSRYNRTICQPPLVRYLPIHITIYANDLKSPLDDVKAKLNINTKVRLQQKYAAR